MNNDVNLTIENTRQAVVDTINQSGLPIGVVYYVLKDIMANLSNSYDAYLVKAEREAMQAAQQAAAAPQEELAEEVNSED